MDTEPFCLRWNQHQEHVMKAFKTLLITKELVDVTIVCNNDPETPELHPDAGPDHAGHLGHAVSESNFAFEAHKVILSASSEFFAKILKENPIANPMVVLPKEVRKDDFGHLLHFMYNGSVDVPKCCLDNVLAAAQILQIKGLTRDRKRKSSPKIKYLNTKRMHYYEEQPALPVDSTDFPTKTIEIILDDNNDVKLEQNQGSRGRSYSQEDMQMALASLREQQLSLTRASEIYGIPATTLWQRANRLGIATPKKDFANKTWSDEKLESALDALRKKEISANKASKMFGIPSSTLYKIARKEGIELSQPFNAQSTSWKSDDLEQALRSIKAGTPVQKAATQFGIPTGTLYGRCKKVGIELTKSPNVNWSEADMTLALENVKSGRMSINQAAINHNLPYSSLYGRINRLKKDCEDEIKSGDDGDYQPFNNQF